jgi:hypothetical protein
MKHIGVYGELDDRDLEVVSGGMKLDDVKESENVIDCRGRTIEQCNKIQQEFDEKKRRREEAERNKPARDSNVSSTAFG